MGKEILSVSGLTIHYETDFGVCEAVNDVSFSLEEGESLGLIGETGAGKTTVALSLMGLLPKPAAHIISGSVLFRGSNLLEKTQREMREICGSEIGMIFQDPMTVLNPVITVGEQVAEVIRLHEKISKVEAAAKAQEMLSTVGIQKERYKEYPHQFSGGMKQRVVIAIALACNPDLLIADEPTTALDVTIQAQVLDSIKTLQKKYHTSLIFISHDFGVIANVCQKCAVMYAGEIVEMGTVEQLFRQPTHPYTRGLFDSIPDLYGDTMRLKPIPGLMSDPMNLPPYCSFYDRCQDCCEACKETNPKLVDIGDGHLVRCIHAGK